MTRFRLRTKLVGLLILVVLLAQLATYVVVQVATGRAVGQELTETLQVGDRVWQRFHGDRTRQQLESALVLADDFGFKAAVASGDAATMGSALRNQASRIGADAAVLLSPDGQWRAGDGAEAGLDQALAPLVAEARGAGVAQAAMEIDGALHQVSLIPVLAPHTIGWLAIGTRLDDAYAADFRGLTGIDASFLQPDGEGARLQASSLSGDEREALAGLAAEALPPPSQVRMLALGERQYYGLLDPLSGGEAAPRVLLQGSLDQAMAPYESLQARILWLSALAGLLALAVAALLGRGITRPLTELSRAAERIQSGDYSQGVPVRGHDEIAGLAGAFVTMQEGIAAREERIRFQANHDGLTGLPNRALAREQLDAAIAGGDRHNAVLMLDLDRFKEINDTLGHGFGDQVLVEVGKRLRQGVRGRDLVARLGGDEFLVLLRDVEPGQASLRARAVLDQLRAPLDLPSTRINLDASLGLALHPEHGQDAQTLLRRADIALYDAKTNRSGLAVYSPGRDEVHLRQLALMGDLRESIGLDQLSLRFQPKVSLADRRVVHVEALLRWTHPRLGPVPPDEFIPLAERSGFVHEITRFVLDRALRQNAQWRREGLDLGIAVNLSAMDLMDADLPDFVQGALRRHGVAPERLILELTESALMRDVDYAVRMLHRLRGDGVRLAIDDFGTGYSSLAQLKRLPVDELKIDKSFVMQLAEGSDDAVIVRSTIELGHNMGLSVIAEGVETDASLAMLASYRCDMVQGFLFSAPLEAPALLAWCQRFQGAEA